MLCDLDYSLSLQNWPPAVSPTTAVVDSSIELFSQLFPVQDSSSILSMLSQMTEFGKSSKLEKNTGRKSAIAVNSTVAILRMLKVVGHSTSRQARSNIENPSVIAAIAVLLKVLHLAAMNFWPTYTRVRIPSWTVIQYCDLPGVKLLEG